MSPDEIRRRRLAYPLTQDGLAKRLGVVKAAVAFWERGKRTPTSRNLDTMRALFAKREGCTCTCHGGGALVRRAIPAWNAEESEVLAGLIAGGLDPEAVADALAERFGYRRTRGAISDRATRLGLTFVQGHSADRIGRMLGVTKHRVRNWIVSGLLPARQHVSVETGRPSRWRHVTADDLAAFVERHAGTLVTPSVIRDPDLRERAMRAAALNGRAS